MNKRLIFSIIGILILVGGLVTVIFLASKQQLFKQKAAPATSLTLAPTSTTPAIGDSFDVGINIDTGANQVAGTELYVSFDSSKLKANSVSLGTFFVSPQVIGPTINNTNGTVFYSIYLPPGVVPKSGTGNLAVVNFTALANGAVAVNFTNDTIVVAVGEGGQNVLQNKNGATINVGEIAQASATPSATPEGTVTPNATKSPSPTPTSTPTLAPANETSNLGGNSQLALATQSPSPTPTASPTPTLAPTQAPLGGAGSTATPVAVSLTSFSTGGVLTTSKPTFSGKAAAGASIRIVIHSDAQIDTTVTANSSGNWSFTPTNPLSNGSHTIAITATDSSNNTSNASASFTVSTGTSAPTVTTQPSKLPAAGFSAPTIISVLAGLGLFVIGIALIL
ncbi:hypothetical protein HYS03_00320 [Candidatus Woesebacteria bacterium]|nr:hypothetical protein [Candidatus Woesebacteria bacterium]QQG47414.1 MAG: hypothetical protein HY044_04805 [Candidatus Woesebacteria bacterium]